MGRESRSNREKVAADLARAEQQLEDAARTYRMAPVWEQPLLHQVVHDRAKRVMMLTSKHVALGGEP